MEDLLDTLSSDKTIGIRSLWLSAFLAMRGFEPIGFEMLSVKDGNFYFRRSPEVEETIEIFYAREGSPSVPVREFLRSYRRMRDICMDARRKEREERDNGKRGTNLPI